MTGSIIPPSPSQSEYEDGDDGSKAVSRHMFASEDPFDLFTTWLEDAGGSEVNDPHAMSLATIGQDGMPNVRIVLLKDMDKRGFVFYTNARSMTRNPMPILPSAHEAPRSGHGLRSNHNH